MPKGFKNKRVLVLNIGLLGGGIATTNWLLDQGARVTVTDFADAKVMAPAVKRVEAHLKKSARDGRDYADRKQRLFWSLGVHSPKLVDEASLVVVNPSVSVRHPYVARALKRGIEVANEGTLFFDQWKRASVGVTGTRGKTTTANWASHLIDGSLLTGNSATRPFQSVMGEHARIAVTELSSFILELFPYTRHAPKVAVITNLYRDHLNRHGTMEEYARTKAAIFMHQRSSDTLVLNDGDEWTPFFLAQGPKAKALFFGAAPLAQGRSGLWADGHHAYWREHGRDTKVLDVGEFAAAWGAHNLENLLAAALSARVCGVTWKAIAQRMATVPQVPFRQETVHQGRALRVVNDTTATSPEGTIAAVRRWGGPNCVLIAGGTDRELEYARWADAVRRHLLKTNLIFLEGSATLKMRKALGPWGRGIPTYPSLAAAYRAACKRANLFVSGVVLFSPGAKSFELFQNEFDRGQQFNVLVRENR
jgi:UDP-N-acetylmuramoylalanine--D-glutamate ligase